MRISDWSSDVCSSDLDSAHWMQWLAAMFRFFESPSEGPCIPVDLRQHRRDDAIASRAVEGKKIVHREIDIARQAFTQQAACAEIARPHGGFRHGQYLCAFFAAHLLHRPPN